MKKGKSGLLVARCHCKILNIDFRQNDSFNILEIPYYLQLNVFKLRFLQ